MAICIQAQEHETPNAQQARRMFMEIYNKVVIWKPRTHMSLGQKTKT